MSNKLSIGTFVLVLMVQTIHVARVTPLILLVFLSPVPTGIKKKRQKIEKEKKKGQKKKEIQPRGVA